MIRKGLALDPNSVALNADLAMAYYFHREYDRAIEGARRALEIAPDQFLAFWVLGSSYAQKHDMSASLRAFEDMRRVAGDAASVGYLGWGYAMAGKPEEARRLLGEIDAIAKSHYVPPQAKVTIYIGLGDKPRALALLEKMADDHASWLKWVPFDPFFDPLRGEPRFQAALHRFLRNAQQPGCFQLGHTLDPHELKNFTLIVWKFVNRLEHSVRDGTELRSTALWRSHIVVDNPRARPFI